MIFRLSFILLTVFSSTTVIGQDAGKLLRKELILDISVGNDSKVRIEVWNKTVKRIDDPARARGFMAEEVFYFDEAFETNPDIDAFTLFPKGNGKMKKVNVNSFSEEDYLMRGIFYSGTKKKIVSFPNVEKGAELHCTFNYFIKDPHMLPTFFFNNYLACDSSIVTIKTTSSVDLGYLEFFRGYDDKIEFTKKEFENKTIYQWRGANLEPRKYEEDSGGSSCNHPHLIPHIKSYKTNKEPVVPVLRDEKDLFNWYASIVSDFELSADYLSILDELKKGDPGKEELAKRIFEWVQQNVKYIAYEEGIEGFQPRDPNDVIKNRFGDCKDMAVLVSTMMKQCDIECYYAWVGTRDKCYTYEECPTPSVDNHMIAAMPTEDGYRFLDATSSFSEFGVPSGFVQGKEAMIRIAADKFEIAEIPVMESDYSKDMDAMKISLEGDKIIGEGLNTLTGYLKGDYQAGMAYSDLAPEKLFINFHDIGNKSFEVGELSQENTETNSGKLQSNYKFQVKNYAQRFENNVYVNPFLKSVIDIDFGERTMPLLLDEKYQRGAIVTVLLDEGATVSNGIEEVHLKENDFELIIKTSLDESSYTVDYSFISNRFEIQPDEAESVKATLNKMKKLLKQNIELKYEE